MRLSRAKRIARMTKRVMILSSLQIITRYVILANLFALLSLTTLKLR